MKINAIFLILLFQSITLFSDVKFNLTYADEPETGFHIRPEAQAALEEVTQLIGSNWLKHHEATINLKVISQEESIINTLATMRNSYTNIDEIKYTNILKKIIFNQNNEREKFDSTIEVNFHFSKNYNFNNTITPDQLNFKLILIHEITHGLGISSHVGCSAEIIKPIAEDIFDDFIEQLWLYGINEIQGNPQDINQNKNLIEKLNPISLTNDYLDQYILKEAHSPIDIIKANLLLEFKQAIITNTPIAAASCPSFDQLSNSLNSKNITLSEFIFWDQDETFATNLMLLGLQLIQDPNSQPDISKIQKDFITLNLLHDGLLTQDTEENPDQENLNIFLKEIFSLAIGYIENGIINNSKIQQINDLAKDVLAPVSFQDLEETLEKKLSHTNPEKNKYNYIPLFLEQFITYKDNKPLIDKTFNKKNILEYCLLTPDHENRQLYFNGPNTLKYLSTPIPLEKSDPSHISSDKQSIMNRGLDQYPQLHEWDDATTAILLDLGYKVDNYWTRLWASQETATKEDL